METIIGIDPDAGEKGHGVAFYKNGALTELRMMTLFDITKEILIPGIECLFVIENVKHNKPVFPKNLEHNERKNRKFAQNLGACKHSQSELERMIHGFNGQYKLTKPIIKNWGKEGGGKEILQLRTGWSKQSNTDTRSAAHYGYLETQEQRLLRSYTRAPSISKKAS